MEPYFEEAQVSNTVINSLLDKIEIALEREVINNYRIRDSYLEYFVKLIAKSTEGYAKSLKFSININSEEMVKYFHIFKGSYKNSMLKFSWRNMSSGEIAILNLLSNINRINYYKDIKKTLLLFIDEGDLYLHPQWQKKYLDMLLKSLHYLLPFEKVQLIITTHSPFIVSDITNENILFMNPENVNEYLLEDTFAANINELLAAKFFIQDGLTGQFAKNQVNKYFEKMLIHFDISEVDNYKSFINIVGEPLVKSKLEELLNKKIIEESKNQKLVDLQLKVAELERIIKVNNIEKN